MREKFNSQNSPLKNVSLVWRDLFKTKLTCWIPPPSLQLSAYSILILGFNAHLIALWRGGRRENSLKTKHWPKALIFEHFNSFDNDNYFFFCARLQLNFENEWIMNATHVTFWKMSSDDILYNNNNNKESFATTLFIKVWHEV